MEIQNYSKVQSYTPATPGALDNNLYRLVTRDTDGEILAATGTNAIGALTDGMDANIEAKPVQLLGGGFAMKVIQSGAIPTNSEVIQDGDRVAVLPSAAGTYKVIGVKQTLGAGAANDVILIIADTYFKTVT